MKRRQFIGGVGAVAVVWPHKAFGQQRLRRVALLMAPYSENDPEGKTRLTSFLTGMKERGWDNGRNILVDARWPGDVPERAKIYAAEIVALGPDVILASTNQSLSALRFSDKTIPTVFVQVSDPVGSGFVEFVARPSGNTTGFQSFEPEMGGKWLGMLKEASPTLKRVAVLTSPNSTATAAFRDAAQRVSEQLAIRVIEIPANSGDDIERGITSYATEADSGLIVPPHSITVRNRNLIIALAARHRLAAIYPYRFFAADGGLIAYGFDQLEQWRGAADYVDRILRGEKIVNLPVQAPTKFHLVVNLSTAKALGFQLQPGFVLRADEVIE